MRSYLLSHIGMEVSVRRQVEGTRDYLGELGHDNYAQIYMGHLGFRYIKLFNMSFLGREAWQILQDPNSVIDECDNSESGLLSWLWFYAIGSEGNPSPIWHAIRAGMKWLINKAELYGGECTHMYEELAVALLWSQRVRILKAVYYLDCDFVQVDLRRNPS